MENLMIHQDSKIEVRVSNFFHQMAREKQPLEEYLPLLILKSCVKQLKKELKEKMIIDNLKIQPLGNLVHCKQHSAIEIFGRYSNFAEIVNDIAMSSWEDFPQLLREIEQMYQILGVSVFIGSLKDSFYYIALPEDGAIKVVFFKPYAWDAGF